jgi:hypothetical protein
VLPVGIERMDWTAEDWLQWYANQNGSGHRSPKCEFRRRQAQS